MNSNSVKFEFVLVAQKKYYEEEIKCIVSSKTLLEMANDWGFDFCVTEDYIIDTLSGYNEHYDTDWEICYGDIDNEINKKINICETLRELVFNETIKEDSIIYWTYGSITLII